VAAKAFESLAGAGIEPEVVTTSPIKIACHVRSDEVEEAVAVLHHAFELDAPQAERKHA
jgi:aspartate kinase